MTALKNIKLDVLFRIDFFALINFQEDKCRTDKKYHEEKKVCTKEKICKCSMYFWSIEVL